jgi:hypothetical protein
MLFLPVLIKDAFAQIIANTSNNSSNASASSSSQWDVLGDQAFRMEFCFLLRDGTFSLTPVVNNLGTKNNLSAGVAPDASADSVAGYAPGSRWYDEVSQVGYQCISAREGAAEWRSIGLQDVSAVVVTMALLPPRSRILTDVGTIKNAISTLPDFTGTPLANAWQARANSSSSPMSSMRVYERFFYLN